MHLGNIGIRSYGEYSSENYGVNAMRVDVGSVTFYFSYHTVVAVHTYEHGLVVCENCWGPTTGKHLNWIDGGAKYSRLPHSEFEAKVAEILTKHGLQ